MFLSNKEKVVETVERHGEIGVAGLHEVLNLDKGTVRKVALEAVREGRIGARNDGSGYVFYSIDGGLRHDRVELQPAHGPSGRSRGVSTASARASSSPQYDQGQYEQTTDAVFREVSAAPSSSRALVPSSGGANAILDSRFDRRSHISSGSSGNGKWWSNGWRGVSQPAQFANTLDGLYQDPEDAEVALYAAQANRLRAQTEHETWLRAEYQRRKEEEKAAHDDEERRRQDAKKGAEWEQVMRMVSGQDALERYWAEQEEERRAALVRPGATGQEQQYPPSTGGYGGEHISEDLPPKGDGDDDQPDDFDPDNEPTHIADARFARAERARQAATGDYGPKPFEVIEDADDDVPVVKPMMREWSLNDLALCNKLERERKERVAEREAMRARSPEGKVAQLFTQSTTRATTSPNGDIPATPGVPRSLWERLRRHIATPSKPTWR